MWIPKVGYSLFVQCFLYDSIVDRKRLRKSLIPLIKWRIASNWFVIWLWMWSLDITYWTFFICWLSFLVFEFSSSFFAFWFILNSNPRKPFLHPLEFHYLNSISQPFEIRFMGPSLIYGGFYCLWTNSQPDDALWINVENLEKGLCVFFLLFVSFNDLFAGNEQMNLVFDIISLVQVLLGDMGTGKTSLVLRFVKGQFYDFQVHFNCLFCSVFFPFSWCGALLTKAYAAGINNWSSLLHSGFITEWGHYKIWYMGHSRTRTIS